MVNIDIPLLIIMYAILVGIIYGAFEKNDKLDMKINSLTSTIHEKNDDIRRLESTIDRLEYRIRMEE